MQTCKGHLQSMGIQGWRDRYSTRSGVTKFDNFYKAYIYLWLYDKQI